ncbi:hypothetical protein D9M72_638980 [compost metagenome]
MAMVSAGFALGLAGASQIEGGREKGVVARPLAGRMPMLTTYLLRLNNDPSTVLSRFIERTMLLDLPAMNTSSDRPVRGTSEEEEELE